MGSSEYYVRLTLLKRHVVGKRFSGEPIEEWRADEPPRKFDAKPLSLNAGEEIRQGVKETTGFVKLEIQGTNLPIESADRIAIEPDGVLYRITARPVRQQRTTVITAETV